MKKGNEQGGVKSQEMPVRSQGGSLWSRTKEFIKDRILRVDDSPQRIARGVAIAWWVTFAIAPLLGLHIWVALLLAFLLRANKVSMLVFMGVHNPVTMWPIIYLNAKVGGVVASMWSDQTGAGLEGLGKFLGQWQQDGVIGSMMHGSFWHKLLHVMLNVGADVWIGGALLGALAAGSTYLGTKYIVIWYRRKKQRLEAIKQQKKGPA